MSHEVKLQHPTHHGASLKTFVLVLTALFALMILTIVTFQYDLSHHLGNERLGTYLNNVIALTIACIKATLVIAFFMGVKYGTKLIKIFAYMGFVWVTLMGLVFCDYSTRHLEVERGWEGLEQVPVTEMNLPLIDQEAVKKAHVEGPGGPASGEGH